MSLTSKQIEQLQAPLDGSQVKTREQAGRSLSYIEGWAAIDTANHIFGHGEWGYVITELTHVGTREVEKNGRKGWEVGYRARVLLALSGGLGTYEDVGFGSGTDYNSPFAAHESAGKEAVTDALKRALKNLGYPFGLALYDKTQEHVEYNAASPPQAAPSAPSRLSQPSAGSSDGSGAKEASEKQVKMLFALGHKLGIAVNVQESVHAVKAKHGIIPMAWVSKQIDRLQDGGPIDDGDQRKAEAKEPDGAESFEEWTNAQHDDESDIPF